MTVQYDPAPLPPDAEPVFPPILHGVKTSADVDPLAKAVASATAGIDAGAIFWKPSSDVVDTAIVLGPETQLSHAKSAFYTIPVGLADALGAIGPPELSVMWDWPDNILINGAMCGRLRADASTHDLDKVPEWIVVGLTLQLTGLSPDPGLVPDVTALHEEGCSELTSQRIIESWSRHTLVWINRWLDDGFHPVHDAWRGRARNVGEPIELDYARAKQKGLFLGLDEAGDMLLKTVRSTLQIPLTAMFSHPRPWPPDDVRHSGADGPTP